MKKLMLFAWLLLFLPSLALADYESVVAADGPTFWWKLQETSGTSLVDSVSGKNMTTVGSPSLNQSSTKVLGKKSILWNGSTQYANYTEGLGGCPYTVTSSVDFTWEIWSLVHGNGSSGGTNSYMFSSYKGSQVSWLFQHATAPGITVLQFVVYNTLGAGYNNLITPSLSGGLDVWSHFFAYWSGSTNTATIFVDGVQQQTATGGVGTPGGCGNNVAIAALNPNSPQNYLNGNLQYVAFWTNTALGGAYALAHYCAGTGGCGLMNQRRIIQTGRRDVPDQLAFALPWRGSSLFGKLDITKISPPAFTKLWDQEMAKDAQAIPERTREERLIVRPDGPLAKRAAMVSREYRILSGRLSQ